MTRSRSAPTPPKSRRRFLRVMTMGTAAALVATTLPRAGEAARQAKRATRPRPDRSAPVEAEVAKQKKSTHDLVTTIRNYELPPGSEMAFAFVPMRATKRHTTPRVGQQQKPAVARPQGGSR